MERKRKGEREKERNKKRERGKERCEKVALVTRLGFTETRPI